MASLEELMSGAYTSPDRYGLPRTPVPFGYGPAGGGPVGPDPHQFRGAVGEFKSIVPWSAISPSSFEPEEGFKRGRQAKFQRKFRRGPLGEYESVDTFRMFGKPDEDDKTTRDFQMTTAGQISDLVGGFTRGIGLGAGEMVGMGRRLASIAPRTSALGQIGPSLPTQEQVAGGIGGAFGAPPNIAGLIGSEPRTSLGRQGAAVGEFMPYLATGITGLGRRILPYLYGGNSILP